jgi:hypothetical protein
LTGNAPIIVTAVLGAADQAWLDRQRAVYYPAEREDVRAYLADMWTAVLTPQDRAAWRPHVTIQNKADPADARALLAELKADFRPRPLTIAGYAAWWYRGGPWEPLSRHMCA